jgi:predicted DNA-binding transcriptional regulator AlpA
MRKTKRNIRAISLGITANLTQLVKSDSNDLIPGPKLRAKLGISPVTLWRWRHDETSGFPAAKVINGRLYFPVGAVSDWLAKQPEVA